MRWGEIKGAYIPESHPPDKTTKPYSPFALSIFSRLTNRGKPLADED